MNDLLNNLNETFLVSNNIKMNGSMDNRQNNKDITDNSNITEYQNIKRPICISLSNRTEKSLNICKKDLIKKYPQLGNIKEEHTVFFENIIKNVFVDGISTTVFIRNNTFKKQNSKNNFLKLSIRPKRYPNDYLSNALPIEKTLLFKGEVGGDYFYIESISDQYDDEVLPYEVECQIIRYDDPIHVKKAQGNFLYELADQAASLNEYTQSRLFAWSDYIDWRRKIVKARMHGVKYSNVTCKEGFLVFTILFKNKEAYENERKLLTRGELAAYDEGLYSDDNGNFTYNAARNIKDKFESIGSYAGKSRTEIKEVSGHLEVSLSYDVYESDDLVDLSIEDKDSYVRDHFLPRFPKVGFLAPIVIKDLSLLKRLDDAINQFSLDRACYSPNMAMWIFDIQNARLPIAQDRAYWEEKIGDNWLNKKIGANPNQREAIYKMLEAPDICLIQGPPGTGKTTVIAEAIYQFVKQGYNVLLASQSHDAVDNALDRLALCQEIRAIRLGERDRSEDEERSIFSQSKVLSTYYSNISKTINHRYIEPYEKNRNDFHKCEKDLHDFKEYDFDLSRLTKKLTELMEQKQKCNNELTQAKNLFDQANKEILEHEQLKQNFISFENNLKRGDISDDFYFSLKIRDQLVDKFLPVLKLAKEKRVFIATSVSEEVFHKDLYLSLKRMSKDIFKLSEIQEKISNYLKNSSVDININQLQIQEIDDLIKEINDKLLEEDNQEVRNKLKAQRADLRLEKGKLGENHDISLSPEERYLIGIYNSSLTKDSSALKNILRTITDITDCYQNVLNEVVDLLQHEIKTFEPRNIQNADEQVKSFKGQLKQLEQDIKNKQKEIKEKSQLRSELSTKYSCSVNDIESTIKSEMDRLTSEWENDAAIRNVWFGTLKKFVNKLQKPNTVDTEYFKDVYVKSCNVVGITCTANMKELDENFSSFDVVIIDEVSKATPPELLPCLMKARKTILVGDHRQLPPIFNEYEKSYNELIETIKADDEDVEESDSIKSLKPEDLVKYRNMVTSSLFKEYFEQADNRIKHSLLSQYRMHSDIQNVINRFYDGKLQSGIIDIENKEKAHNLNINTYRGETFLHEDSHAYWIDSSKFHGHFMRQSRYPGSTSLHNIFEKHIILEVLKMINDEYAKMGKTGIDVGVISFYGSQVGDLRKEIKALRKKERLKSLKVDVNTVDRFQGKEKKIIITSLVCNDKQGNASKHVAAFERINVAFSRAQNLLIIVGAKDLYGRLAVPIPSMDTGEIRSTHIYQGIIDDIKRNASFISGESLIPIKKVKAILDEYEKEAR